MYFSLDEIKSFLLHHYHFLSILTTTSIYYPSPSHLIVLVGCDGHEDSLGEGGCGEGCELEPLDVARLHDVNPRLVPVHRV